MTVAQIIAIMRVPLRDNGAAFWSDAELVPLVDAAQRLFVMLAPDEGIRQLQVEALVDTAAPLNRETFGRLTLPVGPPAFFQIRDARFRASTTAPYFTARRVRLDEIFGEERDQNVQSGDQMNPICAIWGTQLFYKPAFTVVGGCQLFFTKRLVRLTATGDTPEIDETFHSMLADAALGYAFTKIGAMDRATQHLTLFSQSVQGFAINSGDRSRMTPIEVANPRGTT